MAAPTILVTVRGPLKMVDMELPGDVPVQDLIPLLLEVCGSQENSTAKQFQAATRLHVADAHGAQTPLAPQLTLVASNVFDGAVLVLQTNQVTSTHVQNLPSRRFLPKTVKPDTDTGGIGVTWDRLT